MDQRLAEPDYRTLFEDLPGAYLVLDGASRVLAVSNEFLRAFSMKRADLLGRLLRDLLPADLADPRADLLRQTCESVEQALSSGQPHTILAQQPQSAGPVRYWSLSTSLVARGSGAVDYLVHRIEDVSELVAVAEAQGGSQLAILDEQARHVDLSASVPVPADVEAAHILLIEDDPRMNAYLAQALGRHYWVSRAFSARKGLEKALQSDRPDLIIAEGRLPDMGSPALVDELRRHPSLEDVPLFMLTGVADDALRVQLLRQGVVEHLRKPFRLEELMVRVQGLLAKWRRAGQLLRQSEERYRTLFNSVEEGFCIIEVLFDDSDNPVDYAFLETNPSFEKQTGLCQVRGRRAREIEPQIEQHWIDVYGKVALTGEPARFESHAVHPDRWFDTYAFRYGDREKRQVAIVLNDITRRRATEQALYEADRRKDQFLALLAHELRNPLAPVRNAIQILRLSPAGSPMVQNQLLPMMERQVGHMARLLDDLMDVSRISNGLMELRKERIDVALAAQAGVEASKPLIDSMGHQLSVSVPRGRLFADADAVRLAQLVSNLLNNAAHYSPRGSHIFLAARREGPNIRLSVADTGAGIHKEDLDSIFGLFVRVGTVSARREGGLGIGLALVRSLVEMHGGQVEARSAGPGQGSEFIVWLPAAPAPPRHPQRE
jgi:PAS domain S-box-containing protein